MNSDNKITDSGVPGRTLSRRRLIASFGLLGVGAAAGSLIKAYGNGPQEPLIEDQPYHKPQAVSILSSSAHHEVSTIDDLRALTGMSSGDSAQVLTTGRAGTFIWSALNHSGDAANDPLMGVYVPPAADPTGASGCWIRERTKAVLKPEWFGAAWDGITDDTAAIQHAVDLAEPDATILYSPGDVRIDGTVSLSKPGKHIAAGTCFRRTVTNNSGQFFHGQAITGLLVVKGARFFGNVNRTGPGYSSTAACIRFDDCADVRIYDIFATGGASGIQAYRCNALTVMDSELTGNVLTGISGISNNVVIKRIKSHKNGYTANGLTHEVYFLNSSNGLVSDSEIGDHLDPVSSSLIVRYDGPQDDNGAFSEVTNWTIRNCRFSGDNGPRFNSLAATVALRKPVKGIKFVHNECVNGAGLRIDEPEQCVSANNVMDVLTVAGASQYPGYVIGFASQNDRVKRIHANVLTSLRFSAIDGIRFENTILDNGNEPAFNVISGYGGIAACSIIHPVVAGTGAPFDSGFLTRYRVNRDVKVMSATGLKLLHREDLALATASAHTPNNHKAGSTTFYFAFTDPAGTLIHAPDVATEGMLLEIILRNTGGAGRPVTFDAVYKLSAQTAGSLGSSDLNQFMYLKFIHLSGAWRQLGEAAWTQA